MGSMIAPGFGYVIGGVDVPFRDDPGVVAVVVEAQTLAGASAEVTQLEDDLRADGWTVVRVETTAMTPPPMLRAALQRVATDHAERFRAAILLGAVPRAFSGNINPDGHADHQGAWPADGYYADFDGN
jgi:murein endopeptidase